MKVDKVQESKSSEVVILRLSSLLEADLETSIELLREKQIKFKVLSRSKPFAKATEVLKALKSAESQFYRLVYTRWMPYEHKAEDGEVDPLEEAKAIMCADYCKASKTCQGQDLLEFGFKTEESWSQAIYKTEYFTG